MQAIREIVTRANLKNIKIPEEFGDEFEMILLPIVDSKQINSAELNSLSNEEKWKKYANWEPNAKTMDMCSYNMLGNLDRECGSEGYQAWQK